MEKNKYMLCIDNGLSVGKTALIDLSGKIAGDQSFKNEVINDGCFSEADMNLLAKKTLTAIKEVIQKTNVNPSDIISVGNSGHGPGITLVLKCTAQKGFIPATLNQFKNIAGYIVRALFSKERMQY